MSSSTTKSESGLIGSPEQLDELLAQYDAQVGLPPPVNRFGDVEKTLSMGIAEIEAMTPEDCTGAAARLTQYAIYIQRTINKESCRQKWCNAIIDRICAREWQNYDKYLKADVRVELIARENELVNKVIKIRNHTALKIENLFNIASLIKYYSDIMIESARAKRRIYER